MPHVQRRSHPLGAALAAALVTLVAALAWAAQADAASYEVKRVKSGLSSAVYVTGAPGQANRLFIVQQGGRIRILERGRLLPGSFLNLSGRVSSGGEQGLLGLAFHPRYATNGRFFVNYTDRSGDTRIVEFRRRTKNRARTSGRVLLMIRQPYANHNGGQLAFGPDGLLHIGTGDGGSGGDPENRAQDLDSLLGKILRIDIDGRSPGLQYRIPEGNPFRGAGRGEIYAYGLRNPWRFSFDRARGDIWIGDVGQNAIEEIDFARNGRARGANFGWNAFEGRSGYGGRLRPGSTHRRPVAQYSHASGSCSVTGGYVYRGTKVPALRGRYVFADYCSGRVWSMRAGPNPGGLRQDTRRIGTAVGNVTSFGEGNDGTLYLIGQAGGTLYRFVAG
jgi:glucose/arabinose dehydrogenase